MTTLRCPAFVDGQVNKRDDGWLSLGKLPIPYGSHEKMEKNYTPIILYAYGLNTVLAHFV